METELLGQILSKNCARLSKTSNGSENREERKQKAVSNDDIQDFAKQLAATPTNEQRARALAAFVAKTKGEE